MTIGKTASKSIFRFGISDHRENHETLPAHHCRTLRDRGWLLVSEINIIENTRHDFRIEAFINGKRQKYIAGRKSDLAAEVIAKGRNKMPVENKKELVERLLLPLARR